MRTFSPTELETFNDCALKHHYRYTRRLRQNEPRSTKNLASGRAVHSALQAKLTTGGDDDKLIAEGLRETLSDERDVQKYMTGALRAFKKIPAEVFEGEWHVEEDTEAVMPLPNNKSVIIKGRIDLWRVKEGVFGEIIEILDVKTTANDALDYILWSPQLRLYAYCLKALHTNKPITYSYVCVPTTTAPASISPPFGFTQPVMEETVRYVDRIVSLMAQSDSPQPRESRNCKWCDFADVCKTRVMGGDPEGPIEQLYYVSKRGGENV